MAKRIHTRLSTSHGAASEEKEVITRGIRAPIMILVGARCELRKPERHEVQPAHRYDIETPKHFKKIARSNSPGRSKNNKHTRAIKRM